MGGHGALICFLKNPGFYKVGRFICHLTGLSLRAVTCSTCYVWVCLIFSWCYGWNCQCQPQSNKFAMGVANEATGVSKLKDSCDVYQTMDFLLNSWTYYNVWVWSSRLWRCSYMLAGYLRGVNRSMDVMQWKKMTRNTEALQLDVAIKFALFSHICKILFRYRRWLHKYFVDSHPVNAKAPYHAIQGISNNYCRFVSRLSSNAANNLQIRILFFEQIDGFSHQF